MNLKKLMKYLTSESYRYYVNLDRGYYENWPDEKFIKKNFKIRVGYPLNLSDPKTFNEKIQWLKLYNRKDEYTTMVDKYLAKGYIDSVIGEGYTVPTLGVWDRVDDIDFDSLPNQFVLKTTNDSGGVVICKDKSALDITAACERLQKSLNQDYYKRSREWVYKNVVPRIIAEEYLQDTDSEELKDYKLMCFNGKVKCTFVIDDRFSSEGLTLTALDNEWNVLPFERSHPRSKKRIPKPNHFEKMIELSEKLSANIPFLRVDFYETGNKLYIGELTFFPGNGTGKFQPAEWDRTLGDWLDLSQVTPTNQ